MLGAGDLLGRYSVLSRLGQGGMGTVYAAYDPQLDRRVAIKVLRPDRLAGMRAEESRALLLQEARAMARLSHPHVVGVHEVGEVDGLVYVSMDFVEGGTLGAWLGRLPLPRDWRAVLPLFIQAGRGLAAAHAAGLVHRDFKPDNVLLGKDGRARVSDFGLAAPKDVGGHVALVGTPGYMAPEQYQRLPADERADVYAFCASLWEGLYGQLPLGPGALDALAEAAAAGRLRPPPAQAGVPRWLHRALLSGLATAREDRPSLRTLLGVLERDRAVDRRRLLAAAVGLGVGLIGAAVGQQSRPAPCAGAEARWGGVWDPERRAAAEQAFSQSPLSFAREAFTGAAAELDRYRAGWVAMETEACQATRVDGRQSEAMLGLRELCLDRTLEQARVLTDLFLQPDRGVIERSGEAVRSLPPLSECADRVALSSRVAPPPAAVAAGVEALRQRLAGAEALRSAGRYEAARTEAQAAAREAAPLGYPPVLAEALTLAGTAGNHLARYAPARDDLEAAVLAAEQAPQSTETLVKAWTQRELCEARLGQPAEARQASQHAHAFLSSVARPDGLAGALALVDGIQEFTGGSMEAAVAHFHEALTLRQKVLGPDSPEVAKALNNLGASYSSLFQTDRAMEYTQQALALTERTLGPTHPQLAEPLANLSHLLRVQGDGPGAERAGRRALQLKEAAYGVGAPPTLMARVNVGFALAMQGHLAEAKAMMEQTAAVGRRNGKPNAIELIYQLQDLAYLERRQGDLGAALAHLAEATRTGRQNFPMNDRLAHALVVQASVLIELGQLDDAEALLREEEPIAARRGRQPTETAGWLALCWAKLRWARGGDRGAFEAELEAILHEHEASRDPLEQHLVTQARAALTGARPDGGR
jgi:tetratricopeptide (TPR) repeat protein